MFKRRYWARQITWLLVVIGRMPIKLDEVDIGFRFREPEEVSREN
jgi:hypothetical protein